MSPVHTRRTSGSHQWQDGGDADRSAGRSSRSSRTPGVEVCFGLPGVHNLRALGGAARVADPARRRAPRAGRRVRGRRLRARDRAARRRADDDRAGRGEHARRGRRGVGVAVADPGDRDRHPDRRCGGRASTAACCTRPSGQAEMFAPVVAASAVVGAARRARADRRRRASAARRPVVPRGADRPAAAPTVDGADGERRWPADGAAAPSDAATPYPLIDAAERPLIWAGSGARDRGGEVRALAERLAAPVLTTYGGRGVLPPEHPCCVGMPPHVEPAGRLWDEADLVIAFGSDLDGMNTQNWLQPQPPRIVAVNVDPDDASKNYRVDAVVGGARPRADPAARRRRRRAPARGPRRGLPRARPARAALPRRDLLRAARRRQRRLRHVHPRLLDRRLPRLPPAAQAAVPDGLGHARLRVPGRARRRARRHRPDRLDLRRRRLPVRLRRARHDGAGAAPVHGGDRRRRRLRDAALRPGARPASEPYGVDLRDARLRARWPRASACAAETVEGLDDAFGEALARHVADPRAERAGRAAEALVPPPTTSPNWYRKRSVRLTSLCAQLGTTG